MAELSRPYSFDDLHQALPGLSGADRLLLFNALPPQVQREMERHLEGQVADRRFRDGQVEFKSRKRKPKPRPRAARRPTPTDWQAGTQALAGIPAEDYLPVIADVEPLPGGRVQCPLPDHEDRNPSATYKDCVWYCHRCGEGGGIFTIAAAISGLGDRGDEFCELRRWTAGRMIGRGL